MKKLLLLIVFAFIMVYSKSNAQSPLSAPKDTLISLNGIGENDALSMISNFMANRSQDKSPTKQSVWIDSNSFHKMVTLILNENKNAKTKKDSIDGVRIYFASDTTVKTGRLKNSIIIVTTKYDGVNDNVPSKSLHSDYYHHNANDPLFNNLPAIKGHIYKKLFYRRGDPLYSNCKSCESDTSCKQEIHYTERYKAESMVQNFGTGPIITNSEWFDLKLLQAFANDTVHDGIRIYFAKHTANETWPDTTIRNKDAFLLVPTQKSAFLIFNGHRDYFNCSITNAYFQAFNTAAIKSFNKSKSGFIAVPGGSGGGGSGGQDNGELCPDNCTQ